MSNISKASVNVLDSFIFFHMLAEGAVAVLNVGELILVLQEELAAVFAHSDRDVGHHVLVELPWLAGAQMRVVHDKHFLVPHVLEHVLIYFYRSARIWVHLVL